MEGLSLDILATNGDTAEMPTYPGGKAGSGAAHRIINLMPPHDVYIEPFAGSAAVAKLKRPAALNILCDLDAAALEMARAAGKPRDGRRGDPIANFADVSGHITRFSDGVLEPRWISFQGDGLDFLEHHHFDGCELVYCDPPYMRSTRKSAKDLYNFEWTDHHHTRLLTWAAETKAMVIISGYRHWTYDRALVAQFRWLSEDFQAMTRRGPAVESLWWNFARPTVLHDDRYLGDGFRERERIRRRQSRWVARLQRMDPAERAALQAAIRDLGKP